MTLLTDVSLQPSNFSGNPPRAHVELVSPPDYPLGAPPFQTPEELARFWAEYRRLEKAEAAADERLTLKRKGSRATLSFPVCPQPARRVVEVGDKTEWWSLRCKRWSCPACREWQTVELSDRIGAAFYEEAFQATYDRAEWAAVYQKLNRTETDYVRLPGQGESIVVITTQPLPESGPAGDPNVMVESAIRARPLGKGIRWSAGGSKEWRASLAVEKAPEPEEKAVLLGTWDHRVPLEKIAEKAAAVGLEPERLEGDGAEKIAGLRFGVPWDDSRYVELRRWVGYTFMDHSPGDPPPDVLDGEEWEAVAVYLGA